MPNANGQMKERLVALSVDTHCARLHSVVMKDRKEGGRGEEPGALCGADGRETKETERIRFNFRAARSTAADHCQCLDCEPTAVCGFMKPLRHNRIM